MDDPRFEGTPPQVISPVPEAVTLAARLRRENRMTDAVAVVESALDEARSKPFDTPFRHRILLALTLAELHVLADRRSRARELLDAELLFAEHVLALICRDGTPDQIHAATTGVRQLRDRAVQLVLLGQPAPEIEAVEWIHGVPATLEALRGRVVLIEFWASRCRSCSMMFGFLNTLHARYADHGLTVVALTCFRGGNDDRAGERALVRRVAAEHDVQFRVGVAPDQQLQQIYGATGIPTFVLIDRAGAVELATSKPDKQSLEGGIARLLGAVTMCAP